MNIRGLISLYNKARYKNKKQNFNDLLIDNKINRKFIRKHAVKVIICDLTYVKIANKWYYLYLFVYLFNREIICKSTGKNKSTELVLKALSRLKETCIVHPCSTHIEEKNLIISKHIEDGLTMFGIQRLLSLKRCSYDNAVAASTFKTVKFELV